MSLFSSREELKTEELTCEYCTKELSKTTLACTLWNGRPSCIKCVSALRQDQETRKKGAAEAHRARASFCGNYHTDIYQKAEHVKTLSLYPQSTKSITPL